MHFDKNKYPQAVQDILAPLDNLSFDYSQQSGPEARNLLTGLAIQEVYEGDFRNKTASLCCLSGLWLLHGFLDESHAISQSIHTAEGSYWHAIMHRAEGDFWNSKYWYRKVGRHAVLESLQTHDMTGEKLVDFCESASSDPTQHDCANEIVRLEWSLLFDACWNSIDNKV